MLDAQFNDTDWLSIEAACGWTVSKSLRENILRVTRQFLTLKTLQRGNFADVKIVLESYDKSASRFFNVIFADSSAASVYAHDLIEANFKSAGKSDEESVFDAMLTLLRGFHLACNTALKELRDLQASPCKSDKAWRWWIWRLMEVIEEAGLPSLLSEDTSGEQCAPFARLVWQLQRCLPEQVRHYTASEAECAKAISDAQARTKRG